MTWRERRLGIEWFLFQLSGVAQYDVLSQDVVVGRLHDARMRWHRSSLTERKHLDRRNITMPEPTQNLLTRCGWRLVVSEQGSSRKIWALLLRHLSASGCRKTCRFGQDGTTTHAAKNELRMPPIDDSTEDFQVVSAQLISTREGWDYSPRLKLSIVFLQPPDKPHFNEYS